MHHFNCNSYIGVLIEEVKFIIAIHASILVKIRIGGGNLMPANFLPGNGKKYFLKTQKQSQFLVRKRGDMDYSEISQPTRQNDAPF